MAITRKDLLDLTKQNTELLAKIDTKLDGLKDSITKVVFALLGIIGANVGTEVLTKKNPSIEYHINVATEYVVWFVFIFVALRLLYLQWKRESSRWLALGFVGLAVTYFLVQLMGVENSEWLLIPLRVFYTVCLFIFGWRLERKSCRKQALDFCTLCGLEKPEKQYGPFKFCEKCCEEIKAWVKK